jgi:hypothetical protein
MNNIFSSGVPNQPSIPLTPSIKEEENRRKERERDENKIILPPQQNPHIHDRINVINDRVYQVVR